MPKWCSTKRHKILGRRRQFTGAKFTQGNCGQLAAGANRAAIESLPNGRSLVSMPSIYPDVMAATGVSGRPGFLTAFNTLDVQAMSSKA